MSDMELGKFLFNQGTNYHAYEYLGCSADFSSGRYEYTFRTWAPGAISVELISDFSGWDTPLELKKKNGGIWEVKYSSEHSLDGNCYKYRITSKSGIHNKGDPYARFSKGNKDGASIIYECRDFNWQDASFLEYRKKIVCYNDKPFLPQPINIYEMHFGSFCRHSDNSFYTYRQMSEILPSYLKKMGYTHVEFMPMQEYPYDGSWGYQICAFYATTSRFGTPDDFKFLINELHKSGIGVIIDWVPAHFAKDEWGLYEFDGAPLYEYQGRDRKESNSWGTRFFDLGREEVQSFLISNALYFFREFHVDGLRVDAVASMIYLDYDKKDGEWIPNEKGTNINLEAFAFFRKLNSVIFDEFPDVLMIAEESGSFNGITKPVAEGGLGFNMKWNMGFSNDFFDYMSLDPIYRKEKHVSLTFPIMYAFKENYILPISHDEVVHGKKSFVDKMFGCYEDKFNEARLALLLLMTYPGKKLTFMGTEYAQFREWDYDNSLEWFMLDYDEHFSFREYVRSLNAFYLSRSELWEIDFDLAGFRWILPDENERNVVVYKRFNLKQEYLIIALNFSGIEQEISFKIKENNKIKIIFDTGNIGDDFKKYCIKQDVEKNGVTKITIPAFSGMIVELEKKTSIII